MIQQSSKKKDDDVNKAFVNALLIRFTFHDSNIKYTIPQRMRNVLTVQLPIHLLNQRSCLLRLLSVIQWWNLRTVLQRGDEDMPLSSRYVLQRVCIAPKRRTANLVANCKRFTSTVKKPNRTYSTEAFNLLHGYTTHARFFHRSYVRLLSLALFRLQYKPPHRKQVHAFSIANT